MIVLLNARSAFLGRDAADIEGTSRYLQQANHLWGRYGISLFAISLAQPLLGKQEPAPPFEPTLPWLSDFDGSGTTRSMSMPITFPKPSHSVQAPSGLLKLYSVSRPANPFSFVPKGTSCQVLKFSRCTQVIQALENPH